MKTHYNKLTLKSSSAVRDMTNGSIYRMIIQFALPIFFSQTFQQLYNTADSFIVGRYLGTNALAAVSSSGNLIFLIQSFFIGATMGAGVVISRYFGADEHDKVSQAIHTSIAFGLVSGIVMTVIGVVFTPTFLVWMKTDPEVLPEAISYFRWYFGGVFSVVMYNIARSIMNSLGDSKRPLIFLIVSSLTNVALDLLFIAVFHWGVWSAAFATILSQGFCMILSVIYMTRKDFPYQIQIRQIRFDRKMLSEILRNGLPSGVQHSVIGLANVIVQSQINSFGTLAMAAYGAHSKVEGFGFLPITSFNMASTVFVSQNLGAGKHDRAKKGASFSIAAGVICAEIIGILYHIYSPEIISLFDRSEGVIQYGVQQARTVGLFYFLLAYSHSVAAVCRGSGHAGVPMAVMLASWCIFRITYIMAVMKIFGDIKYIYWAYPITWFISSVVFFFYYKKTGWEKGFDPSN